MIQIESGSCVTCDSILNDVISDKASFAFLLHVPTSVAHY